MKGWIHEWGDFLSKTVCLKWGSEQKVNFSKFLLYMMDPAKSSSCTEREKATPYCRARSKTAAQRWRQDYEAGEGSVTPSAPGDYGLQRGESLLDGGGQACEHFLLVTESTAVLDNMWTWDSEKLVRTISYDNTILATRKVPGAMFCVSYTIISLSPHKEPSHHYFTR